MDDEAYQQKRQSFLLVFYLLAFGCTFFVLLFAICGGLAVQMAGVTVGVGAFAMLHWFLWGHALTRTMTKELEATQDVPEVTDSSGDDDPYHGRY